MEEVKYYERTKNIPVRECWKIVFKISSFKHSFKLKTVTLENLQDVLHNGLKHTPGTYRIFYNYRKWDPRRLVSSQREVSLAMYECQREKKIRFYIEPATTSADDSEIATTSADDSEIATTWHEERTPQVVLFLFAETAIGFSSRMPFENLKESFDKLYGHLIPSAYQIFYRDRGYNKISVSSQQDFDRVLFDSEGYGCIMFTLEVKVGERFEEITSLERCQIELD